MIIYPGCPEENFFQETKTAGSWCVDFKPRPRPGIQEISEWLTNNIGEQHQDWLWTEFSDGIIFKHETQLILFWKRYGEFISEAYYNKPRSQNKHLTTA